MPSKQHRMYLKVCLTRTNGIIVDRIMNAWLESVGVCTAVFESSKRARDRWQYVCVTVCVCVCVCVCVLQCVAVCVSMSSTLCQSFRNVFYTFTAPYACWEPHSSSYATTLAAQTLRIPRWYITRQFVRLVLMIDKHLHQYEPLPEYEGQSSSTKKYEGQSSVTKSPSGWSHRHDEWAGPKQGARVLVYMLLDVARLRGCEAAERLAKARWFSGRAARPSIWYFRCVTEAGHRRACKLVVSKSSVDLRQSPADTMVHYLGDFTLKPEPAAAITYYMSTLELSLYLFIINLLQSTWWVPCFDLCWENIWHYIPHILFTSLQRLHSNISLMI